MAIRMACACQTAWGQQSPCSSAPPPGTEFSLRLTVCGQRLRPDHYGPASWLMRAGSLSVLALDGHTCMQPMVAPPVAEGHPLYISSRLCNAGTGPHTRQQARHACQLYSQAPSRVHAGLTNERSRLRVDRTRDIRLGMVLRRTCTHRADIEHLGC